MALFNFALTLQLVNFNIPIEKRLEFASVHNNNKITSLLSPERGQTKLYERKTWKEE